ncbi:hypothetical protein WA1_47480 [Scytonema hofmannii PCC 7110]|uniref:eCIS core domain-containing protein n=1 Tax=Scytonema hofmannii PCC 7110 TaxID=128403 RepID=A0A139WXU5_9CYAN|nr:DUF4157 domain-containing protein [Scytonema hofmannii]KYC37265.1 hypothetical protein WA1_47480 [Scytonema hofmannii PCC 7110]
MLYAPTSKNKTKNEANNSHSQLVAAQKHRLHLPSFEPSLLSSWSRGLGNNCQRNLQKTCGKQLALQIRNEGKPIQGSILQRHAANSEAPTKVPSIVHEVLRSPGQALDTKTRALMEQHFGQNFSNIRLHTNAQAAESARAVNALAYTVNHHIVFGSAQYAPTTAEGKKLLAHELTHTIQQSNHVQTSERPLTISHPQDAAEQEANRAANALFGTQPMTDVSKTGVTIARETPMQVNYMDQSWQEQSYTWTKYDNKFRYLGPLPMLDMLKELARFNREELEGLREHSKAAAPYGQQRVELAIAVVQAKKYRIRKPNFDQWLQMTMEAVIPAKINKDQQEAINNFLGRKPDKVADLSNQTVVSQSADNAIIFEEDNISRLSYNPATQLEMNMTRGAGNALTRAKTYLNGHKIEVMSAVNAFKDLAEQQINSELEGDPSDYWGLLPTLAGVIGTIVTSFIPGANVAVGTAIAVAVQGTVQTTATAETKEARGNAKDTAKKAMREFAQKVEAGQAKAIKSLDEKISKEMTIIAATNDEVRSLLETGSDKALDEVVIDYLGIPNPSSKSPFGKVLEELQVTFAGWLTKRKLNAGRGKFDKMVAAEKGTPLYKEDQKQIEAAKNTARRKARMAARERE